MAARGNDNSPRPITDEKELQSIIKHLTQEAIAHLEKNRLPTQTENWLVYHGKVDAKPVDGGSELVATAASDTVHSLIPDILDILMGTDAVCEYIAEEGSILAPLSELLTKKANAIFWERGGYQMLCDALMDACVGGRSGGWACADIVTRRKMRKSKRVFEPGSLERQGMETNPDIRLMDNEDGSTTLAQYSLEKAFRIQALPAGDVLYTADVAPDEAWLIGYRIETRVGKLVEMGFNADDLAKIGSDRVSSGKSDREARDRGEKTKPSSHGNFALRPIIYYRLFARIDIDGDGLPELYEFHCAGPDYKILYYQEVEFQPLAQFPILRIPHGMHAQGTVERSKQYQEGESILLRALMDNAELQNNPMMLGPSNAVNKEQLSRWRRHKWVDSNAPDATKWFAPPDSSAAVLGAKQELQASREESVGIGRSSMGLDANSLASVPEVAVLQAMTASQRKLLFYVRNIAEFGLKNLFHKLLLTMLSNPDLVPGLKLPPGFDIGALDQSFGVRVKVGLGTATEAQRDRVYQLLWAVAEKMLVAQGPIAKGTSPDKMMALLRDYLRNYPSIPFERYFTSPEEMLKIVQQMMQQQAQQPPPPDPKTMEAQANIARKDAEAKAGIARKDMESRAGIERAAAEQKAEIVLEAAGVAAKTEANYSNGDVRKES